MSSGTAAAEGSFKSSIPRRQGLSAYLQVKTQHAHVRTKEMPGQTKMLLAHAIFNRF